MDKALNIKWLIQMDDTNRFKKSTNDPCQVQLLQHVSCQEAPNPFPHVHQIQL
jgi:hypothetical protein